MKIETAAQSNITMNDSVRIEYEAYKRKKKLESVATPEAARRSAVLDQLKKK